MADVEVSYDPIAINSGPVTVALTGLDNIKLSLPDPIITEATLRLPDPIKTETTLRLPDPLKTELKSDGKFAFAIPEPVRVNSAADIRAGIDLQPVVFDQSLRLALARMNR